MNRLPHPYFETPSIAPEDYLRDAPDWVLIDVRAPGEFVEGHIPGAISCPVLDDGERHQVGLTYKLRGQQAAIDLGVELVWEKRHERVASWLRSALRAAGQNPGKPRGILVSCWRGGLRSQLAASWVAEAVAEGVTKHLTESFDDREIEVARLSGGYKGLRGKLLDRIASPHRMHVLAGMTGSGKTILLHELLADPGFESSRVIDLEGLARHRGSSFGHDVGPDGQRIAQPSQQVFENGLGLRLMAGARGPLVVEDESYLIGRISLPQDFRQQMRAAPVVVVETPVEERARFIYADYVTRPLDAGCGVDPLWKVLAENISALERRLGGKETADALRLLEKGRESPRDFGLQSPWIELLLERYYDRAYANSTGLHDRNVVFRGDRRACHEFLGNQK